MSLSVLGLEIEAVVFDLDGVLMDTEAGWTRTEEAFCAAYSVPYTPELAAGTHGASLEESVAVLTAGSPDRVDPVAAAVLLRRLAEEHVPLDARPFEGTVDAIERIRERVPVAIASNSERPLLERLLESSGHAVDVVVSASDVAAPKPAPDVYLRATALLGVAPAATLVVEDSATGAAAAKAAGCHVMHFAPVDDGGRSVPHRVATARDHRDLLFQLGLEPQANAHERGRA